MDFSAVILAGGRSRRMGRDKAFLPFEGRRLIERCVNLVRATGAAEVLISGRQGQDFSALGCPVLLDTIPDCGPLGGIERALAVAQHPLVLVLAVDMPRMTSECLRWMVSLCVGEVGAIPLLRDRVEPIAAIYPKRAHVLARRMLGERRLAAGQFAEVCLDEGFARAASVAPEQAVCFANWNTPEEARV